MCGRFAQRYTWDDVQELYELPDGPARNLQAHYNVAPTDPVNVVRTAGESVRELVSMRWGSFPGVHSLVVEEDTEGIASEL
jgi:putative SOS response-associated peptidase YedK